MVPVRAGIQQPEAFRTDARAEGDEVWLGGWALDHSDTEMPLVQREAQS